MNKILNQVWAKSRRFIVLAKAGYLTGEKTCYDDEKERTRITTELSTASESFFRSLGFRRVGFKRVGTSGWLAFTDDVSHHSR